MATAPNPARIGVMPRSPGPNSSEREKSEWMDAATQIIEDLTFALQGVLGNPSINLESSTVISDLSDTAPTAMPPDTTSAAGTGNKASRYDHTHAVAAASPIGGISNSPSEGTAGTFARSDHVHQLTAITWGITNNSDMTWTALAKGPVLTVDTRSVNATYRIQLVWNATVSRPQLRLVEVV